MNDNESLDSEKQQAKLKNGIQGQIRFKKKKISSHFRQGSKSRLTLKSNVNKSLKMDINKISTLSNMVQDSPLPLSPIQRKSLILHRSPKSAIRTI